MLRIDLLRGALAMPKDSLNVTRKWELAVKNICGEKFKPNLVLSGYHTLYGYFPYVSYLGIIEIMVEIYLNYSPPVIILFYTNAGEKQAIVKQIKEWLNEEVDDKE